MKQEKRKILFGNKRSHALNAQRRKWKSNLQTTKVLINGKLTKVTADVRTIKTLRKENQNK